MLKFYWEKYTSSHFAIFFTEAKLGINVVSSHKL